MMETRWRCLTLKKLIKIMDTQNDEYLIDEYNYEEWANRVCSDKIFNEFNWLNYEAHRTKWWQFFKRFKISRQAKQLKNKIGR